MTVTMQRAFIRSWCAMESVTASLAGMRSRALRLDRTYHWISHRRTLLSLWSFSSSFFWEWAGEWSGASRRSWRRTRRKQKKRQQRSLLPVPPQLAWTTQGQEIVLTRSCQVQFRRHRIIKGPHWPCLNSRVSIHPTMKARRGATTATCRTAGFHSVRVFDQTPPWPRGHAVTDSITHTFTHSKDAAQKTLWTFLRRRLPWPINTVAKLAAKTPPDNGTSPDHRTKRSWRLPTFWTTILLWYSVHVNVEKDLRLNAKGGRFRRKKDERRISWVHRAHTRCQSNEDGPWTTCT